MKNFKTYKSFKHNDYSFVTENYSDEERKELADKGFALSDGSFPIKDLKDLKNAIQAYGRAKDQARAAKFIVKRAKALGAEDLIPDTEDFQKSLGESVVTEAKVKVTKKDIKDIEDSGNIDIAYKKAMELLKSLSESVVTEAKDQKLDKLFKQSIKASVKDGEDKLYKLTQDWEEWNVDNDDKYDDLLDSLFMAVELVQDAGVPGTNNVEDDKEYRMYIKSAEKHLKTFNKDIAKAMKGLNESKSIAIHEGKDLGSWNQGGLTTNKNVLITQFVGPPAVDDFGLGRKCIQINVGMDYVSLNPADIVELKEVLKKFKK
tara:strand:- start:1029 stop:1979 length:951 start_codon:yes stop_codon:yes gene_type:complete